jgi:hypothetical protein
MTDYPRFQMARRQPDDCFRQHHGAALVACVFHVADWWLEHRDATITTPLSSLSLAGRVHHDAPQR